MPKDVDLDALTIRVHRGKGNKPRTCALLPASVEYIQRWLDKRAALGANGRRSISCTLTKGTAGETETQPGQPLSSAYVRGWLSRLASKARAAGLDKRIHARVSSRIPHPQLLTLSPAGRAATAATAAAPARGWACRCRTASRCRTTPR
jgi:integrase